MTAAPYLEDTPAVLAAPHDHIVRATLSHPSFGVLPLSLPQDSSVLVTFDEARAPRVEASLSVPLVEGLEAVDARAGVRLEVEAGYRRPDGTEDVQPLCDLGVRRTPRNHAAGLLEVATLSDEALVIDASPAVAEKVTATSPAVAVLDLLGKALSPTPYVEHNLSSLSGAVTIDPVEDRWSALVDLCDRYGAQVYDDGTRTWHALPAPTVAGEPVHTLAVGEGGTVLDPVEDVDRDAWSNYVLLRYRWRTAAGADAQVVATAYVAAGDYAITGPSGRRIFRDDREVSTTQAQANAAAREVLLRQLSRAETLRIRAIAAYWLRPGHTVDVVLPGKRTQRVLVSRVTFDPVQGLMDVVTRKPTGLSAGDSSSDVQTTTPPPDPATPTTPKPPVADPAPPAKLRYVSEWAATATAAYRSNGAKRTDVDAGDLWQGTFSGSYNGNQRSLALFLGANSVPAPGKRGETGKTIAQALTGVSAGDVERVEVVAVLEHSWESDGAAVLFGIYDGTAVPATAPSMAPYATSSSWKKDTSRVVNLTRSSTIRDLVDGSARGVTVGPAPSSSTDYYARVSALRLRITYAK
jgi:hypothetical protein